MFESFSSPVLLVALAVLVIWAVLQFLLIRHSNVTGKHGMLMVVGLAMIACALWAKSWPVGTIGLVFFGLGIGRYFRRSRAH